VKIPGVKNYKLKANITGGKRSGSSSAKQTESVITAELKRCISNYYYYYYYYVVVNGFAGCC